MTGDKYPCEEREGPRLNIGVSRGLSLLSSSSLEALSAFPLVARVPCDVSLFVLPDSGEI